MVQRHKSGWRVQVRVGGEVRGHKWTRKEDALKEERQLAKEKELTRAGIELPKEGILFVDASSKWLQSREKKVEKGELAHGSFAADARRMGDVVLKLGATPLSFINTGKILTVLDDLQTERGLATATRNRYRALLYTFFHDLFIKGDVVVNPVARVPLLTEKPKRKAPLSMDEVEKLTAGCYENSSTLGFCFELMLWEGLRISEAVAVKNGDFSLSRNELHIRRIWEASSVSVQDRTKGNPEGLVIPLFERVKHSFIRHLPQSNFRGVDDFCITNEQVNKPLTTDAVRNRIYHVCKRLKIRKVTPHVFRATFASLAEEAGLSKEDIQKILGHSTVLVTERYVRRTAQPLVEKAERLGFGREPGAKVIRLRGMGK